MLSASSAFADDGFDNGFAHMGLVTGNGGPGLHLNSDRFMMTVDGGASDHSVDDALIAGPRRRTRNYKKLEEPRSIEIAVNKKVFAAATGTMLGVLSTRTVSLFQFESYP